MGLVITIVLLIIGLLGLWKGADWLVEGSSDIANYLKVPPIYIGLTVVAFGTSLPELVVSLFAILTNRPGITIGNIVGSNIANIGLIIGIAALVYPLAVKRKTIVYEFPIMLILSLLLIILGSKNYIFGRNSFYFGRFDGAVFIVIFAIFLYYIYRSIKAGKELQIKKGLERHKNPLWKNIIFIIIGPILLFVGGKLFVESSSDIARIFGVSDVIIGLTVVSIGTSLPELFTCLVAVMKKSADIAVGNVVGSNIFNIAWVLGLVSLIKNVAVDAKVLYVDSMIMVLFTLLFFVFAAKSKKIKKSYGAVMLAGYILYIIYLVIGA